MGLIDGQEWKWSCPVCGRSAWYVRRSNTIVAISPASGWMACRRCAGLRQDDIARMNAVWDTPQGVKKDPDCEHAWAHPHSARWYCTKCQAHYDVTCGCGGSSYICPDHYDGLVAMATGKHGSIEAFLACESW